MIDFILDYMENRGQFANSKNEQEKIELGIANYLEENGICVDVMSDYYKNYILKHLALISDDELKEYFLNYHLISEVNQIVIEYNCDGFVSTQRAKYLRLVLNKLYSLRIGDKYIPSDEVKMILGKYS